MDSGIDLLLRLWQIFYFVVSPLLILAGLGYLIQKTLGLDMPTLTRLNFYFVIPGMVYASVVTSEVEAGDVLVVVAFTLSVMASMAALMLIVAALRGIPRRTWSALVLSGSFYNSANYGLPLQELAYRGKLTPSGGPAADYAVSLQVFVMLVQSLSSFTLGVALAAAGGSGFRLKQTVSEVVRFPAIYALLAGMASLWLGDLLGERTPELVAALTPFWDVIRYVRGAFIAIALCTLGAQLALVKKGGSRSPVSMAVFLRLLGGPAIGLGLVHLFGFEGMMAQVLLISTGTPTAVNVMLLCTQFDNQPDFMAKSVLYSMLLSPVTMTLVIFFAQGYLGPG